MAKLRIYEYAKQLNMNSKEILAILKRLDIKVSNHMSVMDDNMIQQVEQFFKNVKENAARKQAATTGEAAGTKTAAEERKQKERRTHRGKPRQQGANHTHNANSAGGAGGRAQSGKPTRDVKKPAHARQAGANAPKGERTSARGDARTHASKGNGRTGDGRTRADSAQRTNAPKGTSTNKTTQGNKFKPGNKNNNKSQGRRNQKSRNQQQRGGKRNGRRQAAPQVKPAPKPLPEKVEIEGSATVSELAKMLHREPSELIKKLIGLGVMATINQELDLDTITLLASDYGVDVEEKIVINEEAFEEIEEVDDPKDLRERPPVVTIMGHVDHGKTTLLDSIRSSKVTAGESGGITQHIGAYQVTVNDKPITFLDTPGHAAFTTMRARGARVTDVTILVVAADDGVMPQTVEAINHAKAAQVPIIVAVNKMDKPTANPDRIKQELTEYELVPEEWGGDTIFAPISALKGEGIDDLLEMVLLVAEMQELQSNPNKRARGTIIEAELDKGRGPVATMLVQHGTLSVGDALVAGNVFGKVRAMINDRGRRVKKATPSTPVSVLGLGDVPSAGDAFMVFPDERKARAIAEARAIKQRQADLGESSRVTLDDLFKQIQEGDIRELPVIIKGDVHGSVEAVKGSLEKIDIEGVKVKIIHAAAGAVTESDVILASASNAIIIGFNVRPEPNARVMAEAEKVDIRLYRVIYDAIEEIEQAMTGLLDPEYREATIGQVEVRQTFKVSSIGTIAGCYVTNGKITRDAKLRLLRDGVIVHEGAVDTLKRFKDDVKEVAQGYECGVTIENFNDIKEGDVIEAYIMEEVAPKVKKK